MQSRTHAVLPANRVREDGSCIGQIVLGVCNPLGEVSKPEAFDVGFGGDRCRLSKSHVAVVGRVLNLRIVAVSRIANHQIRTLRRGNQTIAKLSIACEDEL